MPILRKVVATGVAMVAGLLMVAGTGSAAPTGAADDQVVACKVDNHPTKQLWKDTWADAPAYEIDGTGGKVQKGTLTKGSRYFYCQKDWGEGYRVTSGSYTNTWWALTDVPKAKNVWVSVVYIKGGENDKPVPDLTVGV